MARTETFHLAARPCARLASLLVAVATVLCTVVWSGVAGAQTAEEKAGARAAANAGADAFDEEDYERAIDLFQRAESIIHSPVHEMYIARSMSKSGRLVEARELFLKVGRENEGDVAEEAAQELEALEPRVPRVTLEVVGQGDGELTISIDERSVSAALVGVAQPLDPGEHTVVVSDGARELTQQFQVQEGAKETVSLDLAKGQEVEVEAAPTPPPPVEESTEEPESESAVAVSSEGTSGLRIASYVTAGLGIVGLGAGTVFALQAGGHASDANDLCAEIDNRQGTSDCSGRTAAEEIQVTDFEDKHKSAKTISIVGFAAGGALVATGITLFILSRPKSTETGTRRVRVQPVVGLSYLGMRGSF